MISPTRLLGKDGVPAYETRRCILRTVEMKDSAALLRNFSDPEVMAHYDIAPIFNLGDVEQLLLAWRREMAAGERMRWVIVLKEHGGVIGSCGFHGMNRERGNADVGYEIGSEYWEEESCARCFPCSYPTRSNVFVCSSCMPGSDLETPHPLLSSCDSDSAADWCRRLQECCEATGNIRSTG